VPWFGGWLTSLPAKFNGKVKVVFKEFPIISDQSQQGAIAALAAGRQGKYVEMHKALMQDTSDMLPEDLAKIAGELNLDVAQFKADLNDKALAKQVDENIKLATKTGTDSTPSFVIGDKLFSGGDRTKIEEKITKLSAT
jgi:protein-disulfide isomerase